MKTKIMTIKKTIYFSVLILSTLLLSCEKDKDPLAACRLDPACEYFTCKVNGVRWEPQCKSEPLFGCTPWDVQYYDQTGYLVLIVKKDDFESIIIYAKDLLQLDSNYNLYKGNNTSTLYKYINNCGLSLLDSGLNNFIKISSIDKINFRIKGEFEFATVDTCGNFVKLTDGEFNLPYRF